MNTTDTEKLAATILNMLQQQNEANKSSEDWKEGLIYDQKGKIENSIENYLYYFTKSPLYSEKLKYNDFLKQKEYDGQEWTDFDEAKAMNNIEKEIKLNTQFKVKNSLDEIFINNTYNPVIEYLKNCPWDGEERISTAFIKCFDIEDTPLVRELSKKWFIAAVKRVFEPGCQFDNMIVLQGRQGIGKTTFCRNLAKGFYTEIKFDEIGNKDIVDKLNKSWVSIIDEMDNFGKKEMASIKSFLSLTQDTTRLAYGRNTVTFKRHCIFIGSLNDETFLKDITSSVERRFWIFKCNKKTMDKSVSDIMIPEYVEQLWGEALHYYLENPNQYLDVDVNSQPDFEKQQREFKTYNDDANMDYIKDILNKKYCLVNGEFNSNIDFLNQYNETNIYEANSFINKIPMSSLIYVLKTVYKVERSSKYIALALSEDWEYKTIFYQGKSVRGLYRKSQKNDEKTPKNMDLPF
jgi:predicted P-loop ATPase